jgi:hypothetical protein
MPIPTGRPKYTTKDITVLICTTGHEARFVPALRKWLATGPAAIIISSVDQARTKLESDMRTIDSPLIHLHRVPHASYREQLIQGLRNVHTDLLVITDDHGFASSQVLQHLATCFSVHSKVGGVTIVRKISPRNGKYLTIWESFGALNQVRRRILHAALAYFHDGQVLNLAGGFTGVRTRILQSERYYNTLLEETWLGRYKITTGDDNTTTRYIVHNGWKTAFLNSEEASVCGGVCVDSNYIREVKRWSRDTARSYLKDVRFAVTSNRVDAYIYSIFNISANYATDVAIIIEVIFLLAMLVRTVVSGQMHDFGSFQHLLWEHFIVAGTLTIFEHFPHFTTVTHFLHIPGTVVYMYLHAALVLYSILTLHKVYASSYSKYITKQM